MILKKLYEKFKALLAQETCEKRLALTWSLAIYVALCPLIGLHTLFIIACGWALRLNIALLFAICTLIHNPWTAIPIYGLDYAVGEWFFMMCGVDSMQWNPSWMATVNDYICRHVGIKGLSLWAFFIGGNLLAIGVSVMLYPIIRYLYKKRFESRSKTTLSNDTP